MKRFICITLAALILSAALTSCQNDSITAEGTTAEDTTAEVTEPATEAATELTAPEYDFSKIKVNSSILLMYGNEKKLEGCTDFHVQKPDIAEVLEDGTVRAISDGVTLIAYKNAEGADKAAACCVLPEGVRPDSSGSSPELAEVGDSMSLSGVSKRDSGYSSSNEAVAKIDDEAVLHFLAPGYTVVTVEGVSAPTFYSYIAFER